MGEGFLDDSLIPKNDGPPEEEVKEDGEGHDPQSPYLNEDQNNHLSELRIEASRIHHNQPSHAHRRGCRKEGIDERGRFRPRGIWQVQKASTHEDHDEEAEDERSLGGQEANCEIFNTVPYHFILSCYMRSPRGDFICYAKIPDPLGRSLSPQEKRTE